jgi:integrase/recombinase XerD
MQATARIFVQKAPAKKTLDNRCPVKLCITHKGQRKYFGLQQKVKNNDWMFISEDDIPKIITKSPRGKYKDIKYDYDRIVREAEDIINRLPIFSFQKFEYEFINTKSNWDNFFSSIIAHIRMLNESGRFSYASSFESLLKSIWEFHNKKPLKLNGEIVTNQMKVEQRFELYIAGKPLSFIDITPGWLEKFEKWMQDRGKSKSTIGIYMRNIRVLFNIAIKKHKIKADYPFNEYKPKTASGRKMALSALQIRKIADYKTHDPKKQYYRDLFMFSFLANGMNLSDISRLRKSNIVNGQIYFIREKTKGKAAQIEIKVPITKQMQNTIDKYSAKSIGHDAYIFNILQSDWEEKRKYNAIKQLIKMVNHYIKAIAKDLEIHEEISSYTARHSWATIAKNSGTSIEYIKEALGHSNVIVTESYLKSFEDTTRRRHSEKIEQQIYK